MGSGPEYSLSGRPIDSNRFANVQVMEVFRVFKDAQVEHSLPFRFVSFLVRYSVSYTRSYLSFKNGQILCHFYLCPVAGFGSS